MAGGLLADTQEEVPAVNADIRCPHCQQVSSYMGHQVIMRTWVGLRVAGASRPSLGTPLEARTGRAHAGSAMF